jgi:AcrR family transcriptional regulator
MRDKEATRRKILQIGQEEFLSKGFKDAHLRDIAKKAGITTGAIYGHYPDKEALFCALVQPVADEFLKLRREGHDSYLSMPESDLKKSSRDDFGPVSQMLDYIYSHFDVFKLLICHAAATGYKDYISVLIEKETAAATSFMDKMKDAGILKNGINAEFISIITHSYYSDVFEIVRRDMPKECAYAYIKTLSAFYANGWMGFFNGDAQMNV